VRRAILVLAVVTATVAMGAGYIRMRVQPARVPPLELTWRATVSVLPGAPPFSEPFGIAAGRDGTILVTDAGRENAVRRIWPDGHVATLATGFSTPSGLALGADGTVFVADTGSHRILRLDSTGAVSTLAGDGTPGNTDGPASQARFNGPIGIAVAPDGRVVVADTYNDRIRVIERDGTVSTLAGGTEPGTTNGDGRAASFDTPTGLAIDARGTIYVADTGNGVVRTLDMRGHVTTPAWAHGDGFFRPLGVAVGSAGDVYVADESGRIVAIRPGGAIRTLAGSTSGFRDGNGDVARFRRPSGVAVLAPGHLVVADAGNALVRRLTATSQLTDRVPTSPAIRPQFDADAFRSVPLLWPVAPFAGPHEIAGSFGEVRGTRGERFHRGVDVRIEQGTHVHAVRDGVVSSPISNDGVGSLDEYLRIGELTYVHIRAGRTADALLDPDRFAAIYDGKKLKRLRVKRGARFAAGEEIGTVNRFNHVHLQVGWPGEEHNPLLFNLVQFEDTVLPTIPADGIRVYDETWQALSTRVDDRLQVHGRVHIVIDAWDQTDDNTPNRRLSPYELGFQVLHADGTPAEGFATRRPSLRFDRLDPDPHAPHVIYGAGSGIPFYGRRATRFRYIVTNHLEHGKASEGFWDTARLPPGKYVLRGWAADASGNTFERDVQVTLGSASDRE
jgi:sugar lactone lactonase YvrE/murein DD-endopeptidase MepM/ murein hydrolase activator NlpD